MAPSVSSPGKPDSGSGVQEVDTPSQSWVSRSSAAQEMDRSGAGATPPPIMLTPRQARRSSVAACSIDGVAADSQSMYSQSVPSDAMSMRSIPQSQPPEGGQPTGAVVTPSGTGARRKWLPAFSRSKV
ncbi:hypothetical protein NQ176_g11092 [Zarea fungicola]|uniref:Uncharacterized protein n=1 Tax=Zarea fungicola TaxID=93591 RepID=A0ACC1MCK6_9HYPO|nr:hypothetical protein NQ176_g11092 [Lecanicillium fungicola]